MLRGLKRLVQLACIDPPPNDVLKAIADASNGDIRAAVNLLQFGMLGDMRCRLWMGYNVFMTAGTLVDSSHKEDTLDLFHALGKILYNKREFHRSIYSMH
jgi:DNA polymerase III delta prime subunit